ncbi:MAG TPA: lamin tail domain-containing protein [Puia sp.]|nr:lamin tail domain-containing protein [Puia sp.]
MGKRLTLFICILILFHQLQAQVANRYDIVIDEIFPDPTPIVGLPDAEFIELKNVSSTAYNLRNWQISDGSSIATIKKDFILQPDRFVIICSTSSTAYANFGTTISVTSFPSLNNDVDVIFLRSPEGLIIHAISYDLSWYQNDIKSSGG